MAKIPFSKLGLIKNQDIVTVEWNGYNIEVKQYLPINDKLDLIASVINAAHDGNKNFSNPVQVTVFSSLEILYAYTNINFTDKQKEDVAKLYDLVMSSGLLKHIIDAIPTDEYNSIMCGIKDSIDAVYSYQNSVLGILDVMKTDYDNLNFDASVIQEKLADPQNMELLKGILSELG